MKRILIAILTLMPLLTTAQDNTWERIEVESTASDNPDAKYLEPDAVPVVDGVVCFQTTIEAPGKSAQEIYDILLTQMQKMTKEANQLENSMVALQKADAKQLGAVYHEWLVFKNSSLSLDRTRLNFQLHVVASDGKADVRMTHITYDYDTDRKPIHYAAERWITDEYAVNKRHTRLYPVSAKFRRKTIDRKDYIFNRFNTLLNAKP